MGDGGPVEELLQLRAESGGRHDHQGDDGDAGIDRTGAANSNLAREFPFRGKVVADPPRTACEPRPVHPLSVSPRAMNWSPRLLPDI
jgi:hypothetical protein